MIHRDLHRDLPVEERKGTLEKLLTKVENELNAEIQEKESLLEVSTKHNLNFNYNKLVFIKSELTFFNFPLILANSSIRCYIDVKTNFNC